MVNMAGPEAGAVWVLCRSAPVSERARWKNFMCF